MTWHWTAIAFFMLGAAGVSILTAVRVLRRRVSASSYTGSLLLFAAAVWLVGNAMESASVDLAAKVFWGNVQFLGIAVLPTAWLVYALQFSGRQSRLGRRTLGLLSIVPIAGLLLVLTNGVHGLMWTQTHLEARGAFTVQVSTWGIGLKAFIGYSYALLTIGMLLLVQALVHSRQLYRWQASALLLAVSVAWSASAITDVFGLQTFADVELTPIALGVTAPTIAWCLRRLRLRDILPVAHSTVLKRMADVVIVLDEQQRILNLNRSAEKVIGLEAPQLIGATLETVWPDLTAAIGTQSDVLAHVAGEKERFFDICVSPVNDWRGNTVCQVITLHDVTQLKQRTMELSIMLEVTRAASSTLDVEQIAVLIADHMVEVMRVDSCRLYRWDSKADALTTWIERHRDQPDTAQECSAAYALHDLRGTRTVLETQQPLVVRLSDPGLTPAQREKMRLTQSATLVILPLVAHGKTVGLVELKGRERDRGGSDREIHLCQMLAGQAAVAIEQAQLYSATRQQLQRQITLRQASAAISSALDLDTVLSQTARQMAQAVGATSTCINSYDPQSRSTRVLARYVDPSACPGERTCEVGAAPEKNGDNGWFGKIVAGQHAISHIDADNLAPTERETMARLGVQTILYAPLSIDTGVVGFAEIRESRQRREFRADEVTLCQDIARHAATALEKARLYEKAQQEIRDRQEAESRLAQRNRELLALQSAISATVSSLDAQFVLETVTWEMVNLLSVENCTLFEWDQKNDTLLAVARHGVDLQRAGNTATEAIHLADHPLRKRVLVERCAQQVTLKQPGAVDDGESAFLALHDIKSMLLLPVAFQTRVIGLIQIQDGRSAHVFTEQEIVMAQMLVNQAASAMENARLYARAQAEIRERRRAEAELQSSLEEKTVLLQEIHHRVKNNLQVVSSLLSLQSNQVQDSSVSQLFQESQNRILSMALIHEKLYRSHDLARIHLGEYVNTLATELAASYRAQAGRVNLKVNAEEVLLSIQKAVPCGLIINELISNALKHAFPSDTHLGTPWSNGRDREIRIELFADGENQVTLIVADNGVGLPVDLDIATTDSLGLRLVTTLTNQLDGNLKLSNAGGATFELVFSAS
jgi:PAS domain S-box-containing protein